MDDPYWYQTALVGGSLDENMLLYQGRAQVIKRNRAMSYGIVQKNYDKLLTKCGKCQNNKPNYIMYELNSKTKQINTK